jgi:hypothetical protein
MKPTKIALGGKDYYLATPDADDLDELDRYVEEHRQSPLEIAKQHLEGLSEDLQRELLSRALVMEASRPKGAIGPTEYAAVFDTREGFAFVFWLMAKHNHPDLSIEDIQRQIVAATEQEFAELIRARDEMDEPPHEEESEEGG